MKKIYTLINCIVFCCLVNAQNVGIGTNAPLTKLDINGALSARITSVAASGSVTIPDNVTLFRLTNTAGGSPTALSLAAPKDGQYLTVINEDDNTAILNGYTIPAGTAANPSVVNFINVGGIAIGWKSTGDNNTTGSGATGATGTNGTNGTNGTKELQVHKVFRALQVLTERTALMEPMAPTERMEQRVQLELLARMEQTELMEQPDRLGQQAQRGYYRPALQQAILLIGTEPNGC